MYCTQIRVDAEVNDEEVTRVASDATKVIRPIERCRPHASSRLVACPPNPPSCLQAVDLERDKLELLLAKHTLQAGLYHKVQKDNGELKDYNDQLYKVRGSVGVWGRQGRVWSWASYSNEGRESLALIACVPPPEKGSGRLPPHAPPTPHTPPPYLLPPPLRKKKASSIRSRA